jgi:hypothetical protein
VSSGTTSGTVTYYDSAYYQTATGLARRLLPPQEPTVDRPGCAAIVLVFFLGLTIYSYTYVTGELSKPDPRTGMLPPTFDQIIANPIYLQNALQIFGFFIGIPLLIALLALWSILRTLKRSKQQEKQVAAWRNGIDRWNKMYYCHRDDIVYVEGEQSYATPENMNSVLMKV